MCKYLRRIRIVLASAAILNISASNPPQSPGVTVGRGISADTLPISAF
jgi:hypothetical protein